MTITVDRKHPVARATDLKLLGVAFSGGGIRSATFNLGILQAIAELGMLRVVDYLSTVSGGGYIGSWLISNIQQAGQRGAVAKMLSPNEITDPAAASQAPINFLRDYSNYLTPKKGMFSADTWTMLMIWGRNTFLNLLILIATGACVLLVPRLIGNLSMRAVQGSLTEELVIGPAVTTWMSLIALACLLPVAVLIGLNLRAFDSDPDSKVNRWYEKQHWVQLAIVLPAWFASLACSLQLWAYVRSLVDNDEPLNIFGAEMVVPAQLFFVLLMVVQYTGNFWHCFLRQRQKRILAAITYAPAAYLGFPLIASLVFWAAFVVVAKLMMTWDAASGLWHAITLGTPFFLAAFSLAGTVEIGLMGRGFPDDRREWVSRLGAWITIFSSALLLAFALAIYGPLAVAWALDNGGGWARTMLPAGWVGTTIAALWSGREDRRADSKPTEPLLPKRILMSAGPWVFIIGLLLMLVSGLHIALSWAEANTLRLHGMVQQYWSVIGAVDVRTLLIALAAFAAVAALFSARVDINEFSMHHFYKNRLVRCYLGASRARERRPQPFIGFDARDDRRLCTFRHDCIERQAENAWEAKPYAGPFPIINATLNLVHGDRLSWQDRKGSSFVFTPKYCGWSKERGLEEDESSETAGYRITNVYAYPDNRWAEGGMGVGTAVAISGAAASPNMGYQSAPALAFLMTVFNVRLGWWLGNPMRSAWRKSGPLWGLNYLLTELFGLTTDRRDYVYLSDGGHFENLAIYELVRRRCSVIIACDGEQDPEMTFGGLGNAIRRCRTDFAAEIDIDVRPIAKDPQTGLSTAHSAVGTIYYPEFDADGKRITGTLIYIKASLTGDEPTDVLEYRSRNGAFPHQTTADQFFDEAQFESYRRLGLHIGTNELEPVKLGFATAKSQTAV